MINKMYASVWRLLCSLTTVAFVIVSIPPGAQAGDTFTGVRAKGAVRCGISEGLLLGFSLKEPNGRWSGLDADFCRAVAAAALGDPQKVAFVPLIGAAIIACSLALLSLYEAKIEPVFARISPYRSEAS